MQPHTPAFGFTTTAARGGSSGPAGAVPSGNLGGSPPWGPNKPVAAQPASPPVAPLGSDITAHVEALLALRDGEGVRRYRAQLDDETARRVINDPRIPKERRGALSLAKAFAGNPRYGETSKIIPVDSTPKEG